MVQSRLTRRRRAMIGVVTGLALLAAACGDDGDSGGAGAGAGLEPGQVRLLSAGEAGDGGAESTADSVVLPGEYQVGQTASQQATMSMSMSGPGIGLEMAMDMNIASEVREVTEGEVVIAETIQSVNATAEDPMVQSALDAELASLQGQVILTRYDENGFPVESTLEDGSPVPEAVDMQSADGLFPTEAVGLGATWATAIQAEEEGIEMVLHATYELVELTDDSYTLDFTMTSDLDQTVQGMAMTGSVDGGGQMTGSRSNPLVVDSNLNMDMNMSAEGQSITINMQVEMTST